MTAQYKKDRKEEGAVLLTTILVMSLMAALAVAIIDDVRFAVKRTGNVQAYAQADWYVHGAQEYAFSYLSQQAAGASNAQLNAAVLSAQPVIFPYEGGAMVLTVKDGTRCFPLGALPSEPGRRVFRQLLVLLGWDQASAARLTSIAVDWQDADNQILADGAEDYTYLGRQPAYRTAGRPFASVTELRALETMTETQYQILRRFVCAHELNTGSETAQRINVNTLTPAYMPLLAAALGGDNAIEIATRLILERPAEGYNDEATFLAAPAFTDFSLKEAQMELLTYAPDYIWIEADVSFLQARRMAAFEFSVAEGVVERLYRGFGDEALRPELDISPDE